MTDPILRILSICQLDNKHMFLDAGKLGKILNIETLDEVCSIQSNQPTRYTIKVDISEQEKYMVCGMEKSDIIVHRLDLENSDKSLRCKLV